MAQLGTVLAEFPEEVVLFVTSPRTGLQRRSKWPPTLSEVLEACEQHDDYLKKTKTAKPVAQRLPPPDLQRRQGDFANLFVPADNPRYERMVEWTKGADAKWWKYGQASDGRQGIWIPYALWEGRDPMRLEPLIKRGIQ